MAELWTSERMGCEPVGRECESLQSPHLGVSMDHEELMRWLDEEIKRWPKTLAKLDEAEREEMNQTIEDLCGEIRANGGVKPDWMKRIDESFKNSPEGLM